MVARIHQEDGKRVYLFFLSTKLDISSGCTSRCRHNVTCMFFVTYLEGMQYMGKLRGVQD